MAQAEFEEKEYEGVLYDQLRHRRKHIWQPGQVLEGYIGLDRALFCVDSYIWNLHGYRVPLRGIVLSHRPPEWWWPRLGRHRPLPDFALNLFIQAKRPTVGKHAPRNFARYGLVGRYWKFTINSHQQRTLEALASRTKGRALVCYAGPAFDRVNQLYEHTLRGSVVQNSTFPNVESIKKHSAWYYNQPGKFGIANPDPERIEESPLEERIHRLIEESSMLGEGRETYGQNLKTLADQIERAFRSGEIEISGRVATYFQVIAEIDEYVATFVLNEYEGPIRSFLRITAFSWLFQVQWLVLGREM